jgi:SAM-dependent methyltransferase
METLIAEPTPAEIYDSRFVPALFAQWGPKVVDAAAITTGMTVLDVGCGTGALTVSVAERVGEEGRTVGIDPNPDMLTVARRKPVAVEWRQGVAESLPFNEASFDAVVSQFAMMFFEDRPKALAEMHRVARPGGTVAVAVCGDVASSPGYAAFADLLDRLFGHGIGDAFRAPFVLGDRADLLDIAGSAGISDASVEQCAGEVRFSSIEDLVSTERACAWTLGGLLDRDQFAQLQQEAQTALRPFLDDVGAISFAMPSLILRFRKH